jgi:hypothetical protein
LISIININNTPLLSSNSNNDQNNLSNITDQRKKFLKLPYIESISSVANSLKPFNIVPAWSSYIATKCLFTRLKDLDDVSSQSGLVYKVDCQNCSDPSACYYGETSQFLKKRMNQHKYGINRNNNQHSALCDHSISLNHSFDFENAKIVHRCDGRFKRLIQESLYISTDTNSINSRTNLNGINYYYSHILK